MVPTIVGWRCNRLPVFPGTSHFEFRADRVCDVHFPSIRCIERFEKLSIYQREKVAFLGLHDPDTRTLAPYEL